MKIGTYCLVKRSNGAESLGVINQVDEVNNWLSVVCCEKDGRRLVKFFPKDSSGFKVLPN